MGGESNPTGAEMLLRLDDYLFHLLYAGGNGPLTAAAIVFSALGGGWGMLVLVPLAARPRTRRLAAWLAGTLGLTAVIVFALKDVIGRGRPFTVYEGLRQTLLDSPTDFSLPSGHAAGSFAFALFVAQVLLLRKPRASYAVLASLGLVAFASCVAVSRVVLGFHFPFDVMAGAALGSAIGTAGGRRFARGARVAAGSAESPV